MLFTLDLAKISAVSRKLELYGITYTAQLWATLDNTRSTAVCNGGSLLPRGVSVSNYKFAFKLAALLTLLYARP